MDWPDPLQLRSRRVLQLAAAHSPCSKREPLRTSRTLVEIESAQSASRRSPNRALVDFLGTIPRAVRWGSSLLSEPMFSYDGSAPHPSPSFGVDRMAALSSVSAAIPLPLLSTLAPNQRTSDPRGPSAAREPRRQRTADSGHAAQPSGNQLPRMRLRDAEGFLNALQTRRDLGKRGPRGHPLAASLGEGERTGPEPSTSCASAMERSSRGWGT